MLLPYLFAGVVASVGTKMALNHLMDLKVVTVWYHHENDSEIEDLKEEIVELRHKYEQLTDRPAKKYHHIDKEDRKMRDHCRRSLYRSTRTCREWRANRK